MKKIIVLILLLGFLTRCEMPVLLEDVNPETNSAFKSTSLIIPGDYATIQEVVNAAEDGNIIIIKEVNYPECKLPDFSDNSKLELLTKFRYYFNRYFINKDGSQNEKK